MPEYFFFWLGLSLVLVHEMDAVRCKEWRILPGLSLLKDETGKRIFILSHIPLYFLIFLGLSSPETREGLITALNIFFIIHFVLHLLFIKHKKNEFIDWISWIFIIGIGICGILDIVL